MEKSSEPSPCEKVEEEKIAIAEVQVQVEDQPASKDTPMPTTPINEKLARLGLADRMVVVSPQKRQPIKKAIRRPEPPAQAPMPWWADWAVSICGLSP